MDNVKTIAHLADIHIRKLHRFVEYRDVFKRLYKKLREVKPDLIYIGGDVVHGKLDTSPEEVRLVADFFLKLSGISPTIIIPGNHDCNLNNKSREDVLSPIVDLVKQINPNLYYWKKSGVYTIGDVDFGVMSIFDIDKEGKQLITGLPDPKKLTNKHKVALFHGGVDKHTYDGGMEVVDQNVKIKTFEGYDIVLLGDIHKRQFLNKEETIAYPGSLIQQNFAEAPEHGFLLWDVPKRKSEFIRVENDYGFKTVFVDKGKITNSMSFVPKFGNIKIKYKDTSVEELRLIELDLRKKYTKIKQIVTEKVTSIESNLHQGQNKISIDDIHDLDVQNKLVSKVLKEEQPNIDDETIERIHKINEQTNSSVSMMKDKPRNIEWRLKYIEFDNMFSYGKGSKIDFTKLNGIVGLIAPNHSGKSALFDIISYAIFDACSRTNRAMEVLNRRTRRFEIRLGIEVNGVTYFIHRVGTMKRRTSRKTGVVTKTCPVSVKFYMEENGEMIDLSGAQRSNSQYGTGTNEEIRNILGSFDDFILTSMSLQNNGQNFVEKKQSERKQILSQFLDIELFDKLYDIARVDVAEEKALHRRMKDKELFYQISKLEEDLIAQQKMLKTEQRELNKFDKIIEKGEKKKERFIKKLKDIDVVLDKKDFDDEITKLEDLIESNNEVLATELEYKESLRSLYNQLLKDSKSYDEDKIAEDYESYRELQLEEKEFDNAILLVESSIKEAGEKLSHLEKYEYDENCEYCLTNGKHQIEDKRFMENEIKDKKAKLEKIKLAKLGVSNKLIILSDSEKIKNKYEQLTEDLKRVESDAYKNHAKLKQIEKDISEDEMNLSILYEDKKNYDKNKALILHNEEVNKNLKNIVSELDGNISLRDDLSKKVERLKTNITVIETNKLNIEDEIKQFIEIEQKINDYSLYLNLVARDGIPRLIINDALPIIENEVNAVLQHMMVGFELKIRNEDKNINIYIKYDEDEWALDLSSGMEKFVSSLALRVGLINVSNLPHPSFLVIDEGFGTLDSENLANMKGAFNYLKTRFQSVFIITHLDTIKDFMDYLLPINKTVSGYSKINYV